MSKIDIYREDLYKYKEPKDRTRKRLIQISEMGMTEVADAEFGVRDIMSGLYIEKVWRFTDEEWDSYIEWVHTVIKKSGLNG